MEINKVNSVLSASAVAPAAGDTKFQATRELAQAVAAVNGAKFFGYDSELTFAMDRETRRMVVRLVDRKTRDVIRQIPPEYLLRIADDLRDKSE